MKASKCEMCELLEVGDFTICPDCCRELGLNTSVGCNHDFFEITELGIKRCSYCDLEIPFIVFEIGQVVRAKRNIVGYVSNAMHIGVTIREGQLAVVAKVYCKNLLIKSASGDKSAMVRKSDMEIYTGEEDDNN